MSRIASIHICVKMFLKGSSFPIINRQDGIKPG